MSKTFLGTLYKSKPVVLEVIEAFEWQGKTKLIHLINRNAGKEVLFSGANLILKIQGKNGLQTIKPGDYIVRSLSGEFWGCSKNEFLSLYEELK